MRERERGEQNRGEERGQGEGEVGARQTDRQTERERETDRKRGFSTGNLVSCHFVSTKGCAPFTFNKHRMLHNTAQDHTCVCVRACGFRHCKIEDKEIPHQSWSNGLHHTSEICMKYLSATYAWCVGWEEGTGVPRDPLEEPSSTAHIQTGM